MVKRYRVSGMSCAACSARVEGAVSALSGVDVCSVNLLTGEMRVEGEIGESAVIGAVIDAGYGASVISDGASTAGDEDVLADKESPRLLRRLIWSLGFLALLMYLSMGHMIGLPMPDFLTRNPVIIAFAQMLLALIVMIINRKFFVSGIKGVLHLAPNMDTLVSLGSLASFGYSVAVTVMMIADPEGAHGHLHGLYFESAAMILALITVGKYLEARAKGRTTDALRSLLLLKPKRAVILRDGVSVEVDASEVGVGDRFIVRAGDSVPVDGVVESGEGALDESSLTGESIPTDKAEGAVVYAATAVKSGYLVCRATAVGEGTVISGIIRMVEEASSTKAPIAKLADRVSGIFVPVVISIAILTFIGWIIAAETVGFALARAVSVLVISCPCALGLATPVAIMVGSGVGARCGILYKTAASLEEAGRVRTVVLDKTGTITKGETSVSEVYATEDLSELLSMAYSLEYYSEHPLGEAVVRYAKERRVNRRELSGFKTLPGKGVCAELDGKILWGVSFGYAKTITNIDISLENKYKEYASLGKTPIVFVLGDCVLGMLAISDSISDGAKEGISLLHSMGIKTVMLTGDNEICAAAVAGEVGIARVIAGVLPGEKARVIKELKSDGRVAMVGDGINDAPSLTEADVGIAVGRGTDIAIESADIVLMNNRIADVAAAISLGRSTLLNIKENLAWAFIYNLVGIPMAAGLFGLALDPMFGALAMSLSSFSVVMNALRLNLWKAPLRGEISAPVSNNQEKIIEENEKMVKVIKVEGMMCPHCEARVKKTLEAIEGVVEATPSHESGTVSVTLDGDVDMKVLEDAIVAQGYSVIS